MDYSKFNIEDLLAALKTQAPNVLSQLLSKSPGTPLFSKGYPGDAIMEAYNRGYDMNLVQDRYNDIVKVNPSLANPEFGYDATYFVNYDLLKHLNQSDMAVNIPENINTNYANGYLDTNGFPSDEVSAYGPFTMNKTPAYDSSKYLRMFTDDELLDALKTEKAYKALFNMPPDGDLPF